MSEPQDDDVDPDYRKVETTVNSLREKDTSYALVGACFSAAACAGCLATLTLYAGISPKPWFFYFAGFYVPVGAGLAMYMGLRFLREK
ncbi:hypothetical protein R9X49_22040 [Pectobacterium carotovorum]|uniref:hypothetical protein n=1 Tax=Pectobacterium carotovorum TaxID=554 RepID=UPI0029D56E05|nr:hypothetical protein [Pectobacterium carotovorum]MDX6917780.1 hypothetical protein [Pectobacterium carotovorum]